MAADTGGTSARASLTRDDVVDAAVRLLDEQGLDALTMRGLAREMDVFPTTLYWHVGNRSQLIAKVCQRVFSEMDLPDLDSVGGWQAWIRRLATEARRTFHAHPNIIAPLASQLQVTSASFPMAEAVLTALSSAGYADQELADAYNTVVGTLTGWVFAELATEPTDAEPDWHEDFRAQLHACVDHAPLLAANLPYLENQAFMLRWSSGADQPLDRGFAAAVDTLIAGLEARLPKQPTTTSTTKEP